MLVCVCVGEGGREGIITDRARTYPFTANFGMFRIIRLASDVLAVGMARQPARHEGCTRRCTESIRIHSVQLHAIGYKAVDCRRLHFCCCIGSVVSHVCPDGKVGCGEQNM